MFKKSIYASAIIGAALFLSACSHTQVKVRDAGDSRLTCTEIAAETAEINMVLKDIDDKTGLSGRNVGLGLLFWPGIVVNQMNAGDARKAANDRLGVLADLSQAQNCP